MPYTVYVGDSSSDLRDLRPLLIEQIKQAGMQPAMLEAGEERSDSGLLDVVRRKIHDADYFMTIIAFRRGWSPPGLGGKSLSEVECDLAREAGKPSAVLLPQPGSEIAESLGMRAMLQSPIERLEQLKFWAHLAKLGEATYFKDEAELAAQIASFLRRWSGKSTVPAPARSASDDWNTLADWVAERTAARLHDMQLSSSVDMTQQAMKFNEALRLWPGELVFGRPSDRRQFKSDVFMIMPFAAEFNAVYEQVRGLAAEMNLTVRRGDEFSSSRGYIMDEVWSALNACRFVIADISGGNHNVLYELGIAHTLNKPALLITQTTRPESVPFDVRHLRYIQYDNSEAGMSRLRQDLKAAVEKLLMDLEEGWGT